MTSRKRSGDPHDGPARGRGAYRVQGAQGQRGAGPGAQGRRPERDRPVWGLRPWVCPPCSRAPFPTASEQGTPESLGVRPGRAAWGLAVGTPRGRLRPRCSGSRAGGGGPCGSARPGVGAPAVQGSQAERLENLIQTRCWPGRPLSGGRGRGREAWGPPGRGRKGLAHPTGMSPAPAPAGSSIPPAGRACGLAAAQAAQPAGREVPGSGAPAPPPPGSPRTAAA